MAREMNKAKTGANAVVFVVLVLAGVLALNLIASRHFARVDFTQDHIYTLSPASKELVKKLPDRMTVKAFISSDLQPPFSQVAQYVRDLLDEYANASKGKLKWEAIDPGSDQKLEDEAQKLKVPKMRRGRISDNKVEIGSSYLGIAFEYGGQVESIPQVNSAEGLEFQITSIIKRMTVRKKKLAFATSEGELSTAGSPMGGHAGLQIMGQFLKDYDVVPVNLSTGDKPIPDDADALVLAGPKTQMSDRAKFVVDQFLMKGKAVAFFVDGMVISSPRNMQIPGMAGQPQIGQKNPAGIDDLLSSYGFQIRDDLVMEPRLNLPGPVPIQGQLFLANYPTFIAVTKLAEGHPLFDHVKALALPFASSIEYDKTKQPDLTATPLAWSSPNSWRQSGFFLFDPQNNHLKVGDDHGPFVMAYAATGKLKSFFAGKPYPNAKGEKVTAPPPNVSLAPGVERPLDESTGTPRILVVADSNLLSDDYLRFAQQLPGYGSDLLFALNAMDWLAHDDSLAAIRAKGVQSRPLTYESDSTPTVVKYANIIGVPLLFILFGVIRWRLRTARRRAAKL